MSESPPRSLPERLIRGLLHHGLGYCISAQEVFLVLPHFGWILVAVLGLTAGDQGDALKQAGQFLLWVFRLLGGVDERGHGGVNEMMAVWGKVSLLWYGLMLLLARGRGPRAPWSLKRKWALSTAVLAGGFGGAYALSSPLWTNSPGEAIPAVLGMILITSVQGAMALGVSAFLRLFQQLVTTGQVPVPRPAARRAAASADSVLPMLMTGAAVLALTLGVGVMRPRKAPRPAAGQGVPPGQGSLCGSASECERMCEQGQARACGLLSELVEYGLMGASKDAGRARDLMERACGMDDGMSCMRQASALERGATGREDLARADTLYRRACELGNADGCAGVASLYKGVRNGPPADLSVVLSFFSRACDLGKQEACETLQGRAGGP